jgi:tetratricopeptide (TPR) repeat protein
VRAETLNPSYAEAWAFSSEARQQLKQDGLPDLEQALALSPKSAALQALAGLYYRRKGDSQQALQHFMAAAEAEPQRGIWQVEIGSSYADLHNTQKGLEYYQKATGLEPENASIWRLVAQYCLIHDLSVREAGLPAARQAAALAPEDPASADLMGQVMLALGDQASAERFLQQSLEKNADYPAAYLHLGQLYLQQNRLDLAEYSLARAARHVGEDAESILLAQRLLARYFGQR